MEENQFQSKNNLFALQFERSIGSFCYLDENSQNLFRCHLWTDNNEIVDTWVNRN